MKDSDMQRLIKKLKGNNEESVKAALRELYGAAVKGEDISAAVGALKRIITQKPHKPKKPFDLARSRDANPAASYYGYYSGGHSSRMPPSQRSRRLSSHLNVPKSKAKIEITAASVLAVHYANTGNYEQIIELLECRLPPFNVRDVFSASLFSRSAASALKDYGFDRIPEEKRMELRIRALTILGSDEDIDEILDIGEKAIPTIIDIHNKNWQGAKPWEIGLGPLTLIELINKFVQKGIDVTQAVPALLDLLNANRSVMDVMYLLENHADNLAKDGKYPEALKVTKDIVSTVTKLYKGKRDRVSLMDRRQLLTPSEALVQKIHDKMNSEKKTFPVKHQSVRRTKARKVITNG